MPPEPENSSMVRLLCYFCGKSVSTPADKETVIRALLVCPECVESGCIYIPEPENRKPLDGTQIMTMLLNVPLEER